MSELARIVEALLFASDTPLSLDRLCALLEEFDRGDIRLAVAEVTGAYAVREGSVYLAEVAGGYQFRTVTNVADYLRRLTRVKPFRFSRSALETLAIVAYRQPMTRAEIEYLRGVDSGGVLKTLLEKRLIRILGKKDIPGKPLIYGTTREFLEIFSLKDLSALPTLREIQQLSETEPFEEQQELPLLEGEASVEGATEEG